MMGTTGKGTVRQLVCDADVSQTTTHSEDNADSLVSRIQSLEQKNGELEKIVEEVKATLSVERREASALQSRIKEIDGLLAERQSSDKHYRQLFNLAPLGYLSIDNQGVISHVNLAATYILKRPSSFIKGTSFYNYLQPADVKRLEAHLSSTASSHLSSKRYTTLDLPNGSSCEVLLATSAMRRNTTGISHCQIMMVDMSERKNTEKLLRNANVYLEQLAHRDSLTNLPNRMMFADELQTRMNQASAKHQKLAVIYFDLDGFKPINDTLGHHAGDQVLCVVSDRVREYLGDKGTIARVGGDEFNVILHAPRTAEYTLEKAREILEIIRLPVFVKDTQVSVTGSMGVSLYPDHAAQMDALVMGADSAMYQAKKAGKDQVCLFSSQSMASTNRNALIETGMSSSTFLDQIELHYQPIYNTKTLELVSAEALLRWNHPDLGNIMPGEFIPLAEKSNHILDIGRWVVNQASEQSRQWQNLGFHIPIAINISTRQLLDEGFAQSLSLALNCNQLVASDIEIEITESATMIDDQRFNVALKEVEKAGHIITVDDFGTGYSALSRLVHLPVSRLKIDRMFIKDIEHSKPMKSVVKSVVSMAHELGMAVVSEGIEFPEQLQSVVSMQCDYIQGFMMSKAEPPDVLFSRLH